MDSYTITITPNDDSGNTTTLTVDTSTGQARITNVHLHAPDGLTGAQMPNMDVGLLLQAVTGSTHTPTAVTGTPTPAPPATQQPEPAPAGLRPADADLGEPSTTAAEAATPQPANDDTTPPEAPAAAPAPAAKRARSRRPAAARAAEGDAATSGTARRGRKQSAPKKTARKKATAATGTDRVYRRMPDDIAAVYRQAPTAAAIADHYGVPRYTAHGWINRLKKQETATED